MGEISPVLGTTLGNFKLGDELTALDDKILHGHISEMPVDVYATVYLKKIKTSLSNGPCKVKLKKSIVNIGENFNNVIFTDECSIQSESHRRFCCRKRGEPPRNKPRLKHPLKVHIWAGIST